MQTEGKMRTADFRLFKYIILSCYFHNYKEPALQFAWISLWLAWIILQLACLKLALLVLSDGNGNMIQWKSTVFILPVVCNLHFTLGLQSAVHSLPFYTAWHLIQVVVTFVNPDLITMPPLNWDHTPSWKQFYTLFINGCQLKIIL